MPRYKVLKGVAHDIGDSFTSLMNSSCDDTPLAGVLRLARSSGEDTLIIDFITGTGAPSKLLQGQGSKLPGYYSDRFWKLVKTSGSDRSFVRSASLRLNYVLEKGRQGSDGLFHCPYVCQIFIVDVRGRMYSAHFQGWWCVESRSYAQQIWQGMATWFRARHLTASTVTRK